VHVVVDSSLWIDTWRGEVSADEREIVARLWREGGAVLPQIIWLELIAGLRSPEERRYVTDIRTVCDWEPLSESDGFEAEKLAVQLHKKGLVLPASDLLILTVAKRLGAQLLHHDEDFTRVLKLPEFARQRAK
jgi:predicted nucleic acid-binding protein